MSHKPGYDFLVIGAGIVGLCTAIELRKRKHHVAILNPDKIPHPLAASTDISKIIRMEYGTDMEYMEMAIESIARWREWNTRLDHTIYHETGFVLASNTTLDKADSSFESASYFNLLKKGFTPERLSGTELKIRFPAFRHASFVDGFYHKVAGFAESGKAVKLLADYARKEGIEIWEGQTALPLKANQGKIHEVNTKEGESFFASQVIVCAGNFTQVLVPDLQPYFKVTGHPVFHIRPQNPELYNTSNFAVFAADISNTGWYGFPIHPSEGVVKIANHGVGLELNPEKDSCEVTDQDKENLRNFLATTIPDLANDPVVYTRLCCYTDTRDGHFWVDHHPEINNLTIGSGGSGHGFKMGPVLGEMIADKAEGTMHNWSDRYNWRELSEETILQEEARNLKE